MAGREKNQEPTPPRAFTERAKSWIMFWAGFRLDVPDSLADQQSRVHPNVPPKRAVRLKTQIRRACIIILYILGFLIYCFFEFYW